MESMQNKVVLVTGASSGIGLWTVIGLAQQGATVILHARNKARGDPALAEAKARSGATRIELVTADLGDTVQVRDMAAQVQRRFNRLDVLINNAAIITPTRTHTPEDIETQFAVNHLAYFLIVRDLLPMLRASPPARIVNLTSSLHASGYWNAADPQGARASYGIQGWGWYGVTKFYNVLFTYELARRLEGSGVTTNCVHPGVIGKTRLSRGLPPIAQTLANLFLPRTETGAQTPVYVATAPELYAVNGAYFADKKQKKSSPPSYDRATQAALWTYTEALIESLKPAVGQAKPAARPNPAVASR